MAKLESLPKIGPKTLDKLGKLNIKSSLDLLYHFPHRYLDFSRITKISLTSPDESYTINGQLLDFKNIYTRSHKNIQMAQVGDNTGQISLIWFNQPYLQQSLKVGETYSFAGTVTLYKNRKTIIAPEYGQYHTGKIIAVYPQTQGLSSKWFRTTIQSHLKELLEEVVDPMPSRILDLYHLPGLKNALSQIHLPQNSEKLNQARLRLALDEILSLQAQSYLQKQSWLSLKPAYALSSSQKIAAKINAFIKKLPFKLTADQQKVWQEIHSDLISQKNVMNRLLEGDVGSGKTIIAALAAYLNHLNGYTTLILTPTEILAKQHYQNFRKLFGSQKIPVHLLTSNEKISLGRIPKNTILISTHAIIFQQQKLKHPVSLVIIDEQHKFGVRQRSFMAAQNQPPHTLTMTATPIPRTIALTLMGNLSLSSIETLPQGRRIVKTFLVPNHKTADCYSWLSTHIQQTKEQAFIVCPFIDLSETLTTVKSATREYEHLKQVLPGLKLALIHGRQKQPERDQIIRDFLENKTQILVTTPIIEVGIDIPNATTIIIQSADRFGLAGLHQLRGRVGRSQKQSYCYLFTESSETKVINRLQFLESHHQGSEIAQYDLKIRGPGELFSTIQHGFPSLKIADLSDHKIISLSQKILKDLIQNHRDFNLACLTNNLPAEIETHSN